MGLDDLTCPNIMCMEEVQYEDTYWQYIDGYLPTTCPHCGTPILWDKSSQKWMRCTPFLLGFFQILSSKFGGKTDVA
jgi:hypothetical protein